MDARPHMVPGFEAAKAMLRDLLRRPRCPDDRHPDRRRADIAMRHVVTRPHVHPPRNEGTFPGGVGTTVRPATQPALYVTVGVQASLDTQVVDGRTILVVDGPRRRGHRSAVLPRRRGRAAHLALHRSKAGRVLECRRSQSLRYSEREDDRRWRYQGGLYVLTIGAAAGD